MRRILLAVVVILGLVGFGVLWFVGVGPGGTDVAVSDFEPRLAVNTLSVGEAVGEDNETTSCVSSAPPPEGWQLSGTVTLQRDGGGPRGEQTLHWRVRIADGAASTSGTVRLSRYESERVVLLGSGWRDEPPDLDPGATVPATVTVEHGDTTITRVERSLTVIDRSEPMCPEA